jgi:hypothetical protein
MADKNQAKRLAVSLLPDTLHYSFVIKEFRFFVKNGCQSFVKITFNILRVVRDDKMP